MKEPQPEQPQAPLESIVLSRQEVEEILPMLQDWDSEYGRGDYPKVLTRLEQFLKDK